MNATTKRDEKDIVFKLIHKLFDNEIEWMVALCYANREFDWLKTKMFLISNFGVLEYQHRYQKLLPKVMTILREAGYAPKEIQ